jgi:hypothetical protein
MKKKTITMTAILVVSVLGLLLVTACAKKSLVRAEKPPRRTRVGEEVIVERSDAKVPRWAFQEEFEIAREKGDKYIYVISDITDKDRRAAERIAEGDLRKRIAEGIKTLVNSQFVEALSGTDESFSQSFESYVATVADNVAVVGLQVTDTYWEKVQRTKSKEEVEYFYRIVKRARMPYKNYVEARDKAWEDFVIRAETEEEREELNKLIAKMKMADDM